MTTTRTGRTAKTKGVSMHPDELRDASTVEELTGIGFSEVYHRHFAPQMRVAAELLRQARADGVELDRDKVADLWTIHMSAQELKALYTQPSSLVLGE